MAQWPPLNTPLPKSDLNASCLLTNGDVMFTFVTFLKIKMPQQMML